MSYKKRLVNHGMLCKKSLTKKRALTIILLTINKPFSKTRNGSTQGGI